MNENERQTERERVVVVERGSGSGGGGVHACSPQTADQRQKRMLINILPYL